MNDATAQRAEALEQYLYNRAFGKAQEVIDASAWRVVIANEGLIARAMGSDPSQYREDIFDDLRIKVFEALHSYDPDAGALSTYLMTFLPGQARQLFAKYTALLPVPSTVASASAREQYWKSAVQRAETLDSAEKETALHRAGRTLERAEAAVEARSVPLLSYRTGEAGETERQEFDANLVIVDEHASEALDGLLERIDTRALLAKVWEWLTPRERTVLTLRFGLGTDLPKTLAETGHKIGVTGQRVRQIEAQVLRRLRRILFDVAKQNQGVPR